ncbi:hypothetical protein T190115A13A_170077 [Tenacibaculum sp. 190524A02b]|uniref:Uncharacterized protein n=1 Tax=Tenacibaculum vairaonense TaxID=3137860 RepID=A0ABP1FB14_9FLAO
MVTLLNESLPGVHISIKGKKTVTLSDFEGKYSIRASTGDVLVFYYVDYKKEVKVKTNKRINVAF